MYNIRIIITQELTKGKNDIKVVQIATDETKNIRKRIIFNN